MSSTESTSAVNPVPEDPESQEVGEEASSPSVPMPSASVVSEEGNDSSAPPAPVVSEEGSDSSTPPPALPEPTHPWSPSQLWQKCTHADYAVDGPTVLKVTGVAVLLSALVFGIPAWQRRSRATRS